MVCSGRIYSPDESESLKVQNLYHEQIGKEKDPNFIEMSAEDIYKELKIKGYDYGPKFRRLMGLGIDRFKRFYGRVTWDGNWVTFLDAILQSQAIAIPFRKMLVPVMISALRCDPKVLFKSIEESKVTRVTILAV